MGFVADFRRMKRPSSVL